MIDIVAMSEPSPVIEDSLFTGRRSQEAETHQFLEDYADDLLNSLSPNHSNGSVRILWNC